MTNVTSINSYMKEGVKETLDDVMEYLDEMKSVAVIFVTEDGAINFSWSRHSCAELALKQLAFQDAVLNSMYGDEE